VALHQNFSRGGGESPNFPSQNYEKSQLQSSWAYPGGGQRGGAATPPPGGQFFLKKRSIFEKNLVFLGKKWDFAQIEFFLFCLPLKSVLRMPLPKFKVGQFLVKII